ncbi:sulfur carrier protein ThiS adenylyltransferase ThiF [Desulfoluna spongiiphila]|uniref:Sulfur carrier protein ThiS adenylyltransferase n=1 Tax=Desulfoluna spongiiphila TaxID=419481 RepID=A0A1G5J0V9_9BACT|nr:sulfur carrier protein ThiS adenylyltransferase ThiF [Desulfoluna spongiiphila]SCY81328.1 sulfur carrier protein ThiS adenylyltransferase [Desulfoluna spongiiphila]VVS91807.1 thiamine biosynthesis protein thif [Desulfoluna spongiiphila]
MDTLWGSLTARLGKEPMGRVSSARIGIAGAGGLGSNCAMHLVRMGFRRLVIADFDRVEPSNLNRQFFFARQVGESKVTALRDNLSAIEPEVAVETHCVQVTRQNIGELFDSCDAVVEAFDQVEAKQLLVERYLNKKTFLVAASGIGGWGNADRIVTRKVTPTCYVVGDGVTEADEAAPPMSAVVSIAAAKQADLVFGWVVKGLKG